jgi:hypothetical protein
MAAVQEQIGAAIATWDSALESMTAQVAALGTAVLAPAHLNELAIAQQQLQTAHQALTQAIAAVGADPQADPAATTLTTRLQAIALEMHKQLRLLQTDQQFLRAARRPETVAQRRSQMQERITLLQRYGEGGRSLLGEAKTDEDPRVSG